MSNDNGVPLQPVDGPAPHPAHVEAFREQVLELIDDLRAYAQDWDWKYGERWDAERADIAATFDRRIALLTAPTPAASSPPSR